jgi:hypothetical protein
VNKLPQFGKPDSKIFVQIQELYFIILAFWAILGLFLFSKDNNISYNLLFVGFLLQIFLDFAVFKYGILQIQGNWSTTILSIRGIGCIQIESTLKQFSNFFIFFHVHLWYRLISTLFFFLFNWMLGFLYLSDSDSLSDSLSSTSASGLSSGTTFRWFSVYCSL